MDPIILAALAGWAFDDMCPSPPRWPWPWPGPWPWLRKILALIGGGLVYSLFNDGFTGRMDVISTVLLGGVGGIVLASVVSGLASFAGGARVDVDQRAGR